MLPDAIYAVANKHDQIVAKRETLKEANANLRRANRESPSSAPHRVIVYTRSYRHA